MGVPQSELDRVLRHVLPKIEGRRTNRPWVLGLSGLQGSGKSTWAQAVADELRRKSNLNVVVLSLDDLYHDNSNLVKTREADVSNALLRTRGQPGTHDEQLAGWFFNSLTGDEGEMILVPSFDKSRFNGEGDRTPKDSWQQINLPVDVLIFEGWCMGFQAISNDEIEAKLNEAKKYSADDEFSGFSVHTLSRHSLEHLKSINGNLRRYNETFMTRHSLDYLIHLDTDTLSNVYRWRLDQEHALWAKKGTGMPDDAVVNFVQGYMPAYELYLDRLKEQAFPLQKSESDTQKTQLRVLLAEDRSVLEITELEAHP